MREARQHKRTHQIMNENNIDHSTESWEKDQFNNAGGKRRRSSESDRAGARLHGRPSNALFRFSASCER